MYPLGGADVVLLLERFLQLGLLDLCEGGSFSRFHLECDRGLDMRYEVLVSPLICEVFELSDLHYHVLHEPYGHFMKEYYGIVLR